MPTIITDGVSAIDGLKGIGHFTIWFLVGFLVFLIVKYTSEKRWQAKSAF
jgi:hypothetical protein